MANERPIPIRFSVDLINRVDRIGAHVSQSAGGAKITRAEVIRIATEKGLLQLEQDLPSAATSAAFEQLEALGVNGGSVDPADIAKALSERWACPVSLEDVVRFLDPLRGRGVIQLRSGRYRPEAK